jgi:hypothetical protein
MTLWGRVAVSVAVVAIGVGIALLWDPTICVSPAVGCLPRNPNCAPVYCSHEYVPVRLAVGVVAVIAGVLILSIGHRNPGATEAPN